MSRCTNNPHACEIMEDDGNGDNPHICLYLHHTFMSLHVHTLHHKTHSTKLIQLQFFHMSKITKNVAFVPGLEALLTCFLLHLNPTVGPSV